MARSNLQARAGFTLLEMSISIAILGLLMGAVTMFQQRSQAATGEMQVRARAEGEARSALDTVVRELVGVGANQISPDPTTTSGSETITFQKPVSVSAAGTITWSLDSRIALALDTGETDNGVDDDDDGFVDERRLVFTRDVGAASQKVVTLIHDLPELVPGEIANVLDDNGDGVVDERGFNVQRTGDLLTVRLCVQRMAPGNSVVTVRLQTALVLHN